ncbi:MAG: pyridoxamine 5'-phosphate oxidase family protein, partial [Acidobacteriota bacterium]
MTSQEIALDAARRWLDEARAHPDIRHAQAATLATVDADGRPDARVLVVHEIDARGFAMMTDVRSPTGAQLGREGEPARGALVFHWRHLERQLRARGP